MYNRLLVGGPMDGRLAFSVTRQLMPSTVTGPDGHYISHDVTPAVTVYVWIPDAAPVVASAPVDLWTKPVASVDWGVHKQPFGQVQSPR